MTRSEVMSRVRHKDTKPEMVIRRGLHARGFRYRLHDKKLPGRPDIVLPRWRAAVEVRGCYWHGHEGCGRMPKTRQEFWGPKIAGNRKRDARNEAALRDAGWRLLIVWECCLVGTGRWDREELLERVADWVRGGDGFAELEGSRPA
ncbi:very short patch repair endonuclease [Salipiger bermudensis]|uniref:very short patch repair endonuclease n=1 Tax=Salipiger bermudensis TaxID=344736 RepID=UPI001CD1DDF4|nr:very short patch repair endonuclease [Salipiger bermudensis]MCA0961968.1 very short patch repair endonuclease [Salipiger bermudensis]